MSSEYVFTVFTPTYNRAHLLHRVYESLVTQSFRDFEWLIVDDGSRDETESMVSRWRTEADFAIRYLYQDNQGKHVAYNHAVPEARGQLFLTLDSDDACIPDALGRLKHYWDTIPEEQKPYFSAVTVLCMDEEGRVIGDRFPEQVTDSDSLEIYYKFKVRGDKWGFQRTDIMCEVPFPVPNRRLTHIPESIVWSKIARKYKARFVNDPLLRVYCTDESLTRWSDISKVAYSYRLGNRLVLNEHLDYLKYDPMEFLRNAANYIRFSLHLRESTIGREGVLSNRIAKLLCLVAFPVGFIIYLIDKRAAGGAARNVTTGG